MMTETPASDSVDRYRDYSREQINTSLPYEAARLGMAFHEAGHAVLGMAYGMRIATSEVVDVETGRGRWMVTGNTVPETPGTSPWRFAAMAAAGEVAQVGHLMAYGLWTPERALTCAADHDRDLAIDILAGWGFSLAPDHAPAGGKSWAMVRGMARRKVGLLWREIRVVAHAIDERTALTGDEIADLTGLVNPVIDGGAA